MYRKMASIQQILELRPIENADSIELALIEGWHSVVKKGQFQIGEKVVFCEPDSLLPPRSEFDFMKDKKYRIRTCKLRGVTSQGICFPLDILSNGNWHPIDDFADGLPPFPFSDLPVGEDVSEILGITKWEPPVPVQLLGRMRGPIFRLCIPKTDEPRVQNIPRVLKRYKGKLFNIKEKIDGANANYYLDPETGLHCCSRNIDLAPDFEHPWNGDSYWRYATEHNIEEILKQLGGTIALQGELFGEGIQSNKYKLKGIHFRVFNFWDMTNHVYLEDSVMKDTVETFGLGKDFIVPDLGQIILDHTVDDLLSMADGQSKISDVLREGLVFRPEHEEVDWEIGRLSWKAVSNKFLLKHGE
jgi:RNA ligase (TIGR02306 family)